VTIFSASVRKEEAFKFCLDSRNKGALPLDPACPEGLSVRSPAILPYYHKFWKMKNKKEKKKPGLNGRYLSPMKSLLLSSSCFFPFAKALLFFVFLCMCCVVAAIAL
jgi:hypothetical protein